MADPLAALAEREVPERTNFFDPRDAETIIARYGNTRIERAGAKEYADAVGREQALRDRELGMRGEELRMKRDALLLGREDEEYQARKDALMQQGEFISQLNELDHTDPEYDAKVTEFMSSVPPPLLEEPGIKATLLYKNKRRDSFLTEQEMQARRQETQADRKEILKMRYENDPRLAVLSPEEQNKFYHPETGEFDFVGAAQLAYSKSKGEKMAESKELIAERAKATAEAQTAKSAEIDRRKAVSNIGVKDQVAFPSQLSSFRKAYPKFNLDTAKPEELAAYETAKAYDKDKLESEMSSALSYETADDYVNLVPGVPKAQKDKRRELWNLAHEMKGNAAPTPVAATPAAEKFVVGKSYKDAKGRSATYLGGGKWRAGK